MAPRHHHRGRVHRQQGGRSLWDDHSKGREYRALCRELNRGAAELDETRARIRTAVVDPLDAELWVALGPAAAAELRRRIEVPVNQAAAPVWAALAAALGSWYPDPESLRSQVEQGVRQAVPAAAGVCNRWMRNWWQCQPVARQRDGALARLRWLPHHGPRLAGADWEPFDGYATAGRLWWWPHPDFVVVSDPPRDLQLEQVGAGAWQLHRADGPAVAWPDGPSLYFWHSVAVPGDLIERGWDVETIHRHPTVRSGGPPSNAWAGCATSPPPACGWWPPPPTPATRPIPWSCTKTHTDAWATPGSWS